MCGQRQLRTGIYIRSRSADNLNLTEDCPDLGEDTMSWLKAWLKVVALYLIGFLKRRGGEGEG